MFYNHQEAEIVKLQVHILWTINGTIPLQI